MTLRHYHGKRDFVKTPEPKHNEKDRSYKSNFVVQLHDASHLHYDFRLKIGNTLKSWAVPKGPSMKTTEKRLAVETEDHPLSYGDFEGIIPEKQYGAGVVLIWDTGRFKNVTLHKGKKTALKKAYLNGHIIVELQGKKLQGKFVLQRFNVDNNTNWMLIKMEDEFSNNRLDVVKKFPKSVASGLTLSEYKKKYLSKTKK